MTEDSSMDKGAAAAPEGRFEALIEQSSEIIVVVARDGRVGYLNSAFERTLGLPVRAWLGRQLVDLVWPQDADRSRALFARSLSSPGEIVPWQLQIRHADGGSRWLEGTLTNRLADPRVQGIVVTCRDITERVEAERALHESERRLQQAVRVARIGIFDHDHVADTVYWSPRLREIHGWEPDGHYTLADVLRQLPPDDAARITKSVMRAHDPAGDGAWDMEYRIVRPDGALRRLIARSFTTFEGEGAARRPSRTVGAIVDVTDRWAADETLRLKNQAIETSINAIALTDAEGCIHYVNPAFVALWGYSSDRDILGRAPMDFIEPAAAKKILDQLGRGEPYRGEVLARRKDGTTFEVAVSANLLRDEAGNVAHMMGSFVDVSESKRLQSQLLQSQKMESIGRLAGGVAHDFNNLLTVMNGFVDLALMELDEPERARRDLDEVRKAADSAAGLTQQLLAFSRKQVIRPQVLDLNEVVRRVQKMLQRLLGEDVQLHSVTAGGLWPIRFDLGQVEQILVNLAVNARDSMPNGGKLTVETANVALGSEYSRSRSDVQPGDYVLLAVSDTGSGMSPEVRERIFEPFFTTKAAGQGTGLGLAMVYGAVSQNGGRIEVYSEIGVGTAFKIYLPRVREAAAAARPAPVARIPRGTETIAVVEDEESVRLLAARVLRNFGYEVLCFSRPGEAIDAISGMAGPLHLVVTDVIMPEMNGRQMAQVLIEKRPGLRILYTSGYTANVIVHHGVLQEGVEFLPKPYSAGSLARRVREVLDKEAP